MSSKPPFFAQEQFDTCMLACLRMILADRGMLVPEDRLAGLMPAHDEGYDPDQVAEIARGFGLKAEARQLNLGAIAALIEKERFPIVLVDRTFLDGEFAIHAVVPIRITRHFAIILDPLRGERRVSRVTFLKATRRVDGWAVVWDT